MDFISEHRQVPIRGQYDLIICGGGISGLAAAVATGEAAGAACALCLRSGAQNHTLDLQLLQSILTASGVQLHENV